MTLYQELIADGREAAEERVHVEHRGDRATVTLADPEKLNPLSAPARPPAQEGARRARRRLRHLDAQEAQRLGLVHEVVPHDKLLAAADAWCDRVAELPPHALAMTKPLLRAAADATWDHALAMEEFAEPGCFTTATFAAAVKQLQVGAR